MKKSKKKARKLLRRVRDFEMNMTGAGKKYYPGQYHRPGSYK